MPSMLARVCSAAVQGIEAFPVEVEVNAGWGDTNIIIVGRPDAAVRIAMQRRVPGWMATGRMTTDGTVTPAFSDS